MEREFIRQAEKAEQDRLTHERNRVNRETAAQLVRDAERAIHGFVRSKDAPAGEQAPD